MQVRLDSTAQKDEIERLFIEVFCARQLTTPNVANKPFNGVWFFPLCLSSFQTYAVL